MSLIGSMPYRTLGHTGEQVSLIGLGGSHLGKPSEAEAIRIIRTALDEGVNFIDNSWDYHDGASEERVGRALKDGYRQKAFVMTKFDSHYRRGALQQIEESLRRLQVDTIDLVQQHEVIRPDDPDKVLAPGGSIEGLLEMQRSGKVRYIGFTGHKDPDYFLKMLDMASSHGVTFDTVQMPLNVMDAHFRSFEKKVLPVLLERGIAPLAMKALGDPHILRSRTVSPVECLHYAMNLPVSVVITGIESMAILDQALSAARTFRPMSEAEVSALLARTARAASGGEYEPFKTTHGYDGTYRNPEWLEQGAEMPEPAGR